RRRRTGRRRPGRRGRATPDQGGAHRQQHPRGNEEEGPSRRHRGGRRTMTPGRTPCYGFRVCGPMTSRRRLIGAVVAFAAYSGCADAAQVGHEAYLAAFTFGGEFRRHREETGSTRGFGGPCWAPWIWFDIDREDDLESALVGARRLSVFSLYRFPTLDDNH